MPQLIATDLDGTILFDRKVSPADLDAMRRWRAAGNLLVVDTGKSVFATRDTLEPLGVVFDYAVTFTGAVLVDGDYREEERDLTLHFRGSRNQRVIDLAATRATGTLTLLYADE